MPAAFSLYFRAGRMDGRGKYRLSSFSVFIDGCISHYVMGCDDSNRVASVAGRVSATFQKFANTFLHFAAHNLILEPFRP